MYLLPAGRGMGRFEDGWMDRVVDFSDEFPSTTATPRQLSLDNTRDRLFFFSEEKQGKIQCIHLSMAKQLVQAVGQVVEIASFPPGIPTLCVAYAEGEYLETLCTIPPEQFRALCVDRINGHVLVVTEGELLSVEVDMRTKRCVLTHTFKDIEGVIQDGVGDLVLFDKQEHTLTRVCRSEWTIRPPIKSLLDPFCHHKQPTLSTWMPGEIENKFYASPVNGESDDKRGLLYLTDSDGYFIVFGLDGNSIPYNLGSAFRALLSTYPDVGGITSANPIDSSHVLLGTKTGVPHILNWRDFKVFPCGVNAKLHILASSTLRFYPATDECEVFAASAKGILRFRLHVELTPSSTRYKRQRV